jgi:predicted acetyltransferase
MSAAPRLEVTRVGRDANTIVTNLFEFYMHDMAEWFRFDTDVDGKYHYDLDRHWDRGDRFYLARVDGALAGFAVVGPPLPFIEDPNARDINEFFVLRRYRRERIGEHLARAVWDAEPADWLVRVFEGNRPAVPFWRGAIARYTDDRYVEERRFHNEKWWAFFTFSNGPAK